MTMNCEQAGQWVPRYQDGELDEELAAPLRQHRLSCPACRELAKAEVSLKRWFPAQAPQAVPAGFAAHVARRALAGDGGYEVSESLVRRESQAPETTLPARTGRGHGTEAPLLPFVLRLTALAAALLLALAVGLQTRSLPESTDLDAENLKDVMQVIEALDAAEALNAPGATGATGASGALSSGDGSLMPPEGSARSGDGR